MSISTFSSLATSSSLLIGVMVGVPLLCKAGRTFVIEDVVSLLAVIFVPWWLICRSSFSSLKMVIFYISFFHHLLVITFWDILVINIYLKESITV